MSKAEEEAIDALWHVVYNGNGFYSNEMQAQAIRSLGAYVHHEAAVGHLHTVIHDTSNRYSDDLRMLAIHVLGKRK